MLLLSCSVVFMQNNRRGIDSFWGQNELSQQKAERRRFSSCNVKAGRKVFSNSLSDTKRGATFNFPHAKHTARVALKKSSWERTYIVRLDIVAARDSIDREVEGREQLVGGVEALMVVIGQRVQVVNVPRVLLVMTLDWQQARQRVHALVLDIHAAAAKGSMSANLPIVMGEARRLRGFIARRELSHEKRMIRARRQSHTQMKTARIVNNKMSPESLLRSSDSVFIALCRIQRARSWSVWERNVNSPLLNKNFNFQFTSQSIILPLWWLAVVFQFSPAHLNVSFAGPRTTTNGTAHSAGKKWAEQRRANQLQKRLRGLSIDFQEALGCFHFLLLCSFVPFHCLFTSSKTTLSQFPFHFQAKNKHPERGKVQSLDTDTRTKRPQHGMIERSDRDRGDVSSWGFREILMSLYRLPTIFTRSWFTYEKRRSEAEWENAKHNSWSRRNCKTLNRLWKLWSIKLMICVARMARISLSLQTEWKTREGKRNFYDDFSSFFCQRLKLISLNLLAKREVQQPRSDLVNGCDPNLRYSQFCFSCFFRAFWSRVSERETREKKTWMSPPDQSASFFFFSLQLNEELSSGKMYKQNKKLRWLSN